MLYSRLFSLVALTCLTLTSCHSIGGSVVRSEHAQSQGNKHRCLTRLKKDPRAFEHCKEKVCFVFIDEPLFINVPPKLTESDLRPFPCNKHHLNFSGLDGMMFEVIEETSFAGHQCVFAGRQCTFNGLVDFIADMAKDQYKFTIIGLLLDTSKRRIKHFPTLSIVNSHVVIIGRNDITADQSNIPRTLSTTDQSNPIAQLTMPFELGAWFVVIDVLILYIVVAILVTAVYGGRSRVLSIMKWFMALTGEGNSDVTSKARVEIGMDICKTCRGKHSTRCFSCRGSRRMANLDTVDVEDPFKLSQPPHHSQDTDFNSLNSSRSIDDGIEPVEKPTHEHNLYAKSACTPKQGILYQQPYWLIMGLYRMSLFGFAATFLLFYEAAVVHYLFKSTQVKFTKELTDLTRDELKTFAVHKDTALENVFLHSVNRKRRRIRRPHFPWFRCDEPSECVEQLMSKTSSIAHMVSFDVQWQHLVQIHGAFENLTKYKTLENLYSFDGGWLHNHAVTLEERRKLDKDLMRLRENGDLGRIIRAFAQGLPEESPKRTISEVTVGIPIGVLVMLPLLVVSVCVVAPQKKQSRKLPNFVFLGKKPSK